MDYCWAPFLCLCLLASQSRTEEASQKILKWMQKMEGITRGRSSPPHADLVHGLESELLNASFSGYNLTLQTHSIQALAFKLNCNFAGLSLSSAALEKVPQVPGVRYSEKAMAPHSSTLAWKIPWMEEPEGNGNPLQYSRLENPRDGGAWWAAVYGVAQSRTRLKRLSSSSSSSRAQPQHAMQFPAELTRNACRTRSGELRLICIYFSSSRFFQKDINSSLLNNYVLGAQLSHGHVSNLSEPVNISFWHNQSLEGYTVTCVFWKESAKESYWGAWSPEGCHTQQPSPSQVLCHCNHLTYFAVLMQLSQAPIPAELLAPLTYISLVGCSISIVASLLTVLLHLQARKQSDSVTRIHMNLHASVLLLNIAFLLSPVLATPPVPGAACVMLAATLHFALLSCLTWMAIEGFNLYLLLGRVYNIYIRRYVLKLCAVGWGVPAFLVLLLLAVKSSVYGPFKIQLSDSRGNSTFFKTTSICWVQNSWVHRVLVMGYGGLTSLFNLVVLAWALRVLNKLRAQEKVPGSRACRDTVTVLGLTVLLGTTWALAFFSFSVFLLPQLFLFTIFNSLYGFFLFLWFCSQRCRSEAEAEAEMEVFTSSQMVQ